MLGVIPGINKTYVIEDYFCDNPIEGKLYIDPVDDRVYMYSTKEHRSNPSTGFFPLWNGKDKIISRFSNNRSSKELIKIDLSLLSKSITKDTADIIRSKIINVDDKSCLEPQILNEDNIFTQCIKGVIINQKLSLTDITNITDKFDEKTIQIFYTSLIKITFMRLEKWYAWVNDILKLTYDVTIYKDDKEVLKYHHPSGEFELTDDPLIYSIDDGFKKIIKILINKFQINKDVMRNEDTDEYTINNMWAIILRPKKLSGQIFSRFIKLAGLSCRIDMKKDEEIIFTYKE